MRFSLRKMVFCAAIGLSPVVATIVHSPVAMAYPKPSIYPVSWQLKFEHSGPKRIVVTTPGSTIPKAYWYMTFTVTNLTEQEQRFLPVFEMVTSDGQLIRSDKDVPENVFKAVKQRERNKNLEPMEKITGRLLLGEDQAREGVAIWAEPSPRMGTFQIFIGGLSGETIFMKDGEEVQIKDWTKTTDEERKKLNTLHKTLQLTYQIPGDEIKPEEDVVLFKGEEWLMR